MLEIALITYFVLAPLVCIALLAYAERQITVGTAIGCLVLGWLCWIIVVKVTLEEFRNRNGKSVFKAAFEWLDTLVLWKAKDNK